MHGYFYFGSCSFHLLQALKQLFSIWIWGDLSFKTGQSVEWGVPHPQRLTFSNPPHWDPEINNTDLVPGSPRHWNLQQHWPGAWVTETLKSPTTLTWFLGHWDTEISNNTDLVPGSLRHWPGAWVTETLKSPTILTWCLDHRDTKISNNTDLVPGSQRHWNLQQQWPGVWVTHAQGTEISNNNDLLPRSLMHKVLKSPTALTWCLGHSCTRCWNLQQQWPAARVTHAQGTEISNNTDLVPGSLMLCPW